MNNVALYGFRPYRCLATPGVIRKSVATAYQAQDDGTSFSVDLNIGDPLQLVSTGTVALANTTVACYGVLAGVAPYWDGTRMAIGNKLPGGTTWGTVEERRSYVYVYPAENWIFEVDVDDNVTATTRAAYQAFVGENCTHTCVGDTTSAEARPLLDISLHATTAGLVWRIVDISDSMYNQDYSGTRVKLLVQANITQAPGQAATTIAGV